MAEVVPSRRPGRHQSDRLRLGRRLLRHECRPPSRPDRLRLHGRDDVVRRARSSVASVRRLSAKHRLPAARRARRADDAEPAAISGRPVRRAARGLRRGQLQSALLAARAASSARRFGRRSDRGPGELRPDAGEGDRRNPAARRPGHRRGRSPRRPSRPFDQFRIAPHSPRRPAVASAAGGAPQPGAVARAAPDGRVSADPAGRHRVPAIHRRDDRRAQGRHADPPQHDRQPRAGARLGRRVTPIGERGLRDGAAALPCLRADGELPHAVDGRGEQSAHPQSARRQGLRQELCSGRPSP